MPRFIAAALLEVAGIAAITYGVFLFAPFLALIVGGIGAIALGLAIDPPRKPRKELE